MMPCCKIIFIKQNRIQAILVIECFDQGNHICLHRSKNVAHTESSLSKIEVIESRATNQMSVVDFFHAGLHLGAGVKYDYRSQMTR